MLISELHGHYYFISWDNPKPADSSTILAALSKLGRVTKLQTKTTVALAPRAGVKSDNIRCAIKRNLHASKGNAFYVNLRTGKGFEIGSGTDWHWRSAP